MANFGWGEGAWGEGPWGGLVELSLTINGVEVISNVISSEGSLQIEQNTLLIPILQFQIYNRLSETVAIAAPIPPQEVSLTVRGVLEFGGVISSVLPKRLSETVILYEVTAVGFHRTLDYVTTNRDSFASIKSGVVIKNLLAKYTPWLASDLSAIQDGPVLSQLDVRNRKLSELFSELALSAGFIFYVNNLKKPFFQPLSENKASLIIDDAATTYMFDSLDISPDFSRITNVVRVLGGLQKGSSVTEVFPGTSGLSNFPLKYPVHGADRAAVLFDEFSGTSFNANWVQVDISNPTPPPNHIAADGYIFPEFELLQIVGGPGSYGFVALLGLETQQRKHFREFSCEEVFIVALGEGVVCALTDGVGHAFSDILSGVVFKANGELRIVENGVESGALTSYVDVLTGNTINTAPTFEVGKTYTVMIQTYKVAAEVVPRGVRYLIQGGTAPNFGAVGTRSWAQLKDTQFASDPQEFVGFAPIIDHSAQMTIRQVRIKDTVDVVLTVGGVSKNVGTLTDTSAKNDAVIDANAVPNLLVFFTDSIPATTVEITYFKKEQTVIVRRNAASIERIKGLSPLIGDTGERHSTIEPSFKPESVSDVVRIASNYLTEFSSEKITGRVLTYTPLLTNDIDPPRAGQIMTVNLTSQGIGPLDVVISRVTSSLVSGKYTNSSSQNSVIVRYDIEFSDVDSYEKFLLQNQQDLRVRDLEGVTSQDIQVIDVGSLITLSDVLISQTFPEANPIVGEGIVGLTDLDGTNPPASKPSLGASPNFSHQLMQSILVLLPFVDGSGAQVTDFSGNNNHAAMTGSFTWTPDQQGSIQFTTTAAGNLGNISSTVFSADFTVVFQVFNTDVNTTQFIVTKEPSASNGFAATITGDKYRGRLDGTDVVSEGGAIASTDQRVVITRNGSLISLYVNGVFGSSSTFAGSLNGSSTGGLLLGEIPWSALFPYTGRMSDVRVYDRGFNASDVALDFADPWGMF